MEIRPEDLKARLDAGDSLVLVDVRQPEEFEICRLPGSKLLPLNELAGNLDDLDPKDEIVLICHHGIRSLDATFFLRSNGYDLAKSLAGGVDRWSLTIDPAVPRY